MLRSQSVPGMSSIVLVFDSDATSTGRALVQERLAPWARLRCRTCPSRPSCSSPTRRRAGCSCSGSPRRFPDREVRDSALDDPAAPARRSRCRERGHLGLPGPPAAGSGGSGAAGSERHHAAAGRRDHRERADLLAAELRRGLYAGHRRVHRDPQQRLGVRHVFDRLTTRRSWARSPEGREAGSASPTRHHRRRGPPAADRRCDRERRRRPPPRGREVPAPILSRSPRASRRRSPISGPASAAWSPTRRSSGRRPSSRTRSTTSRCVADRRRLALISPSCSSGARC